MNTERRETNRKGERGLSVRGENSNLRRYWGRVTVRKTYLVKVPLQREKKEEGRESGCGKREARPAESRTEGGDRVLHQGGALTSSDGESNLR